MEENTNPAIFTFDSPKGQSSYIKVIGVGGGGGNAVNHMHKEGIKGVDFIVCNTDMKALNASPVPNKIPLGDLGLGAGNKPEKASKAAASKADDIREALSHNTQMLFITAGMGGGTGTGAAPVVAEIAKSIELENEDAKHILVVAIVTKPFSFEGKRRREQAEAGIQELKKHVDAIIVINNDKLRAFGDLDISQAFGKADDVLLTAAKGIAEIITGDGYVNIDFQDVNTVMEHSGTALMGTGTGHGEDRAMQAIEEATTSVLLDDSDISGAKNILLYFSYNPEHQIKMDEIGEITDYLCDKTHGTADVIWGAGTDDTLDDELKVTLVATGFEKSPKHDTPTVIDLHEDEPSDELVKQPEAKVDDEGFVVRTAEHSIEEKPVDYVIPTPTPVQQDAAVKGHVWTLEDDEQPATAPMATVEPVADSQVESDVMVEGIKLKTSEAEVETPVLEAQSQPAPAPKVEAPKHDPFAGISSVNDTAERIRKIHELLRTKPNGAELVESMKVYDSDVLYAGQPSDAREGGTMKMNADGTITRNNFLFGQQPD